MSTAQIYGRFSKIEQLADGTMYVEGIASSEAVDAVGEIIKASAIKAALPGYLKFPALREMHETWAAGRTVRAEVMADGTTHIAAKVVDAEAIRKVREQVYNGFSIGGSVTKRNTEDRNIIEGLTLTEISLVDRPANPDCVMQLVKLDTGTTQTKEPDAMTDTADTEAAAATVTKADQSKALRKFLGAETMDARMAIEALMTIQALLAMELSEGHPEAGNQIADLQAAVGKIKAFIAAEILEADPAEAPAAGAPAVEAEVVEAAAVTEDLAKKFSSSTRKALGQHHAKLAECSKSIQKIHDEFGKMGWQALSDSEEGEEKPAEEKPADDKEPPAEEKPADDVEAAAKTGDLAKRLTDAEKAASDAGELLKAVMAERDELKAQLRTKGSVRAISKAEDGGAINSNDDEPKDTISLIKAAQTRPLRGI